jgi:hypothetical protein
MPRKQRRPKKRIDEAALLEAWTMTFSYGRDYLCDLVQFGIENEQEAQEAARDAWHRLGSRFMATWEPSPDDARQEPWALETFGEP